MSTPTSTTRVNDLELPCLARILNHLDSKQAVLAACAHPLWRSVLYADEAFWRRRLSEEFACSEPRLPGGAAAASHRCAYNAWRSEFSDAHGPLLARAAHAWAAVEAWLASSLPEVRSTLRPGASRAELEAAEAALGHPLPLALRVIYRLHDGQTLAYDEVMEAGRRQGNEGVVANAPDPSIFHGLFGGYSFYHHAISCRMFSLERMVRWTLLMRRESLLPPHLPSLVLLGSSFRFDKLLTVNAANGDVHITAPRSGATRHGSQFTVRGAPKAQQPSKGCPPGEGDAVLRWLEEYARKLSAGEYAAGPIDPDRPAASRGIVLFPASTAGGMAEAVTRGVRVRAAPLLIPELCNARQLTYAYSIRFCLLGPDELAAAAAEAKADAALQRQQPASQAGRSEQPRASSGCSDGGGDAWAARHQQQRQRQGQTQLPVCCDPPHVGGEQQRPLASCQLMSRRWVMRDAAGVVVDEVAGEAVVGKYPLLVPGAPEFVYQSCNQQEGGEEGSMEGQFAFVEGSIMQPTGPRFQVACPRFHLRAPTYIF